MKIVLFMCLKGPIGEASNPCFPFQNSHFVGTYSASIETYQDLPTIRRNSCREQTRQQHHPTRRLHHRLSPSKEAKPHSYPPRSPQTSPSCLYRSQNRPPSQKNQQGRTPLRNFLQSIRSDHPRPRPRQTNHLPSHLRHHRASYH